MAVLDLARPIMGQLYPRRKRGVLPFRAPSRSTLTGVVYYYLIENRNDNDIVDIAPLKAVLSRGLGLPERQPLKSTRIIHRKMDALKNKYGMHIRKHGKEPYLYEVKPIKESTVTLYEQTERLRELITGCVERSLAGGNVKSEVADCVDLIRSEFTMGRR